MKHNLRSQLVFSFPIFRLLLLSVFIVPLAGNLIIPSWENRVFAWEEAPSPTESSLEKLVERIKPSIVSVTVSGREAQQQGLGTGFVIDASGLIATNMHVIDAGRPISVQFADGKQYEVTAVHASQRNSDLAILKIDADKLQPLSLGTSKDLKQGQSVAAFGNPLGLKFSVVSGVVSGTREIEGREMIQLAIPIEPGNSGGPVVDQNGTVVGIVTMKSAVTANLGFAVQVDALKPLIEKPNTVPMTKWLTIGALDPKEWTTKEGARWRQRAGRIFVEGFGTGFGGRAFCLSEQKPPEGTFEVAVDIKLDNEAGAAGLIVHSDEQHRHYGFYPTSGRMRLTFFQGPDVFSWEVLQEKEVPGYRPGDWNTLKIRVEGDKLQCFLNGTLAMEHSPVKLPAGKVGFAKFRETKAEFKRFRLAETIPSEEVSSGDRESITTRVVDIPAAGPIPSELRRELAQGGIRATSEVLKERALQLEKQAAQLKRLAREVHRERVREEIKKLCELPDSEIDLLRGALLISSLDNEELEFAAYERMMARMVQEIRTGIPEKTEPVELLKRLNQYLFEENGFHGSRGDYYNRSNSYINEVLEDREGLPITLSVIYMELALRLGIPLDGIGLPGHFVVRYQPKEGEPQYLDVFEGGGFLTKEQAAAKARANSGVEPSETHWEPMSRKAILVRMLHNLFGLAQGQGFPEEMLSYVEAILVILPEDPRERWYRAVLLYQYGLHREAKEDVTWLLEKEPEGLAIEPIRELDRILDGLIAREMDQQ